VYKATTCAQRRVLWPSRSRCTGRTQPGDALCPLFSPSPFCAVRPTVLRGATVPAGIVRVGLPLCMPCANTWCGGGFANRPQRWRGAAAAGEAGGPGPTRPALQLLGDGCAPRSRTLHRGRRGKDSGTSRHYVLPLRGLEAGLLVPAAARCFRALPRLSKTPAACTLRAFLLGNGWTRAHCGDRGTPPFPPLTLHVHVGLWRLPRAAAQNFEPRQGAAGRGQP